MGKQQNIPALASQPTQFTAYYESYFREQMYFVLNALPAAVSVASLEDFTIEFCNNKFKDMFGYDPGEFLKVSDWCETTYVDPMHIERARATWNTDVIQPDTKPFEFDQVELEIRCKNGDIKTCLLGGMVLPRERWSIIMYSDISERKAHEQEVEKLAREDDLTGLYNRRGFNRLLEASLEKSRRSQKAIAVMMIDMNKFKEINDNYGHDVGDDAIKAVADTLRKTLRPEDFCGRLGGDEFAVMLYSEKNRIDVSLVADRIIQELRVCHFSKLAPPGLSLSVGLAEFPKHGADLESLLKAADKAMYKAKLRKDSCWSW